jgi:hypothetical protein
MKNKEMLDVKKISAMRKAIYGDSIPKVVVTKEEMDKAKASVAKWDALKKTLVYG